MELGQVIDGKYRLLRVLGDGGMGVVYEAHHEVLGARVAIKVLHADLARKPEIVDRFLREARVLAQISSAHVVRVLDVGVTGEGRAAYIVMEMLAGEPLSSVLGRDGKLPLAVAVDYTSQVLEALAAAHALGVVHRDLKPENVFLTREGDRTVLKVIDFGIAKAGALGGTPANLTIAGTLMGTPEYMAPEQVHSAERADARSDIFAVGVMLYEMLSGARPVDGEDPRVVALKVERGDVKPLIHRVPEVPRDLAGLVHRAMAPRPELRFATAVEMRQALESVMVGVRTGSQLVTPTPTPPPVVDRRTGTMVGAPAGDPPAGPSLPGISDRGAPAFTPPQVGPATGYAPVGPAGFPANPQGWSPVPGAPYGATAPVGYPAPPPPRGRRRGGGGTVFWIVGGMVVFGGAIAAAYAVSSYSSGPATPAPTVSTVPVSAASSAPATPSGTPASPPLTDDAIAPLVVPSHTAHPVVSPPRSSASGTPSSVASASQPPPATPPFGVPPFGLPSGLPTSLPNPFPNGASSGVGPVMTIPTLFPPFGLPPAPAVSTAPSPTHPKGH